MKDFLSFSLIQLNSNLASLNSYVNQQVAKASNYAATTAYQIALPVAPSAGHTYLCILKHYNSTTEFVGDIMLLTFIDATHGYRTWITKNSTATLNSVTVSGTTVTLTFAATVYMSAYILKLTS